MDTEGGGSMLDSGEERRLRRRARAALGCNWGWDEHASKSGTISSLSAEGCFIVTKAPGIKGSEIHVHLWLPSHRWLRLAGPGALRDGAGGPWGRLRGHGRGGVGGVDVAGRPLEQNPPASRAGGP
ncbi:MAG: hypothetical protein LC800_08310 [Acidobacteria bacterium]|nr:hypothetical protein [Acidobacteriota bacterium]